MGWCGHAARDKWRGGGFQRRWMWICEWVTWRILLVGATGNRLLTATWGWDFKEKKINKINENGKKPTRFILFSLRRRVDDRFSYWKLDRKYLSHSTALLSSSFWCCHLNSTLTIIFKSKLSPTTHYTQLL